MRNLDSYFDSARRETSPVDANAARSIIGQAPQLQQRKRRMSIIALSLAAAASTIGALTLFHSVGSNQSPTIESATQAHQTKVIRSAAAPDVPSGDVPEQQNRNVRVVATHVQHTPEQTSDNENEADAATSISVSVLAFSNENLEELHIDPLSIGRLRELMLKADRIEECGGGNTSKGTRVCVWSNGKREEVVLGADVQSKPIMITTDLGEGRVLRPSDLAAISANDLIPVHTETATGNTVLWFAPTKEVSEFVPSNMRGNLRSVMSVHADVNALTFDNAKVKVDSIATIVRKQLESTLLLDANGLESKLPLGLLDSLQNNLAKQLKSHQHALTLTRDSVSNLIDTIREMRIMIETDSDITENNKLLEVVLSDNNVMMDSLMLEMRKNMKNLDVESNARQFSRDTINGQIHTTYIHVNRVKAIVIGRPEIAPPNTSVQENRQAEGAVISTSLYPNPATDGGATISYDLREPRTLSAELVDLAGNRIATLFNGVHRTAGKGQTAFTFGNVPPGMYLVVLTTERGERTVQRMVVQ